MVDKVYILGSSFGGALAYIMGVEHNDLIDGIIAVSAPSHSDFHPPEHRHWLKQIHGSIKAVEHNIHHLNIPVLIMHGADDKVVKTAQAFYAFNKVQTEQKKLLIYNKIGHSLGFGFNTEEVADDIDNFIRNYSELVQVRFEYKNINAEYVSIAGEFNNWNSKADYFKKVDNETWVADLYLSTGNYQYKLVINGNNWILDPQSETVPTPKGEYNSIVRV
jgi:pimeloyl-ACP methyl ester carboxylesterase